MNPENRRAKVSKWSAALRRIVIAIGAVIAGILLAICSGCRTSQMPPIPPQHPHQSESILLRPFAANASLVETSGDFQILDEAGSVTVLADSSDLATYYVLFTNSLPLLDGMRPAATNYEPVFTVSTDKPQQFFQMKAGNQYGLSGWATK